MITQRIDPSESLAIIPPRGARADTRTSPERLRARFARHDGLPFADVLTEARIPDAHDEHGVTDRDRVFRPVTTLGSSLSQVLSEDQSGRDAGTRLIAPRAAHGRPTCSPDTASSCNARGRLSTAVRCTLTKWTARELQAGTAPEWKWNGRDGLIADGSHGAMPDAPANQAAYPQPPAPPPGLGFPRARILGLLSWATGAGHDRAIAPYEGKGTGATALLRERSGALKPGDVVLAASLFDTHFPSCQRRQRGIDIVARAQDERVGSEGLRDRPDGAVVVWRRPNQPHGMTGEQYRRYPKTRVIRQVSADARDRDNRGERFQVIATLLDASIDGAEIGDLDEPRWEGEVDIRSIKSVMPRDVRRCQAPEMVRQAIWAHLLAYNLLRTVRAVAAAATGLEPRPVSFTGAKPAVTAFAPKLEAAPPKARPALIDAPLEVVAYHRVGDRPGRWEPRARKRRPKPGAKLGRPRAEARPPEHRSRWY